MQVFLTGATGYIGHVVAEKLVARGDTVMGLARSDAAADTLRDRGIQPVAGDLNRPGELTPIAGAADAVVHLGFQWGDDVSSTIAAERRVVEALMAGVAGRGAALLFASGTSMLGKQATRCSRKTRRSRRTRSISASAPNGWCWTRPTFTAS